MLRFLSLILVGLVVLACSSTTSTTGSEGVRTASLQQPERGSEPAVVEVESEPPGGAGPASGNDGDIVVVATVVDSGPIGDGQCVQCSHEISIEEQVTGDLGEDRLWVHYEVCGGQRPAAPSEIDPCTLRRGSSYELRLRRGTSENFGNDPMIVSARAP